MDVEHDYAIEVNGEIAVVADNYVNHSVLLDGTTGEPIEDDPDELLQYTYAMRRIEGVWKVTEILRG